jgi:hypothetical protein
MKDGKHEELTRRVGRLLSLKMLNDPMNDLQIDLFEGPDGLINFALPKKFDEHLSLPRPSRLIRKMNEKALPSSSGKDRRSKSRAKINLGVFKLNLAIGFVRLEQIRLTGRFHLMLLHKFFNLFTIAENYWACRRANRRPRKPPRIIPSAIKNSPALHCGSAQSVTKVAC